MTIKLRAVIKHPSRVIGGSGISVTQQNGILEVSLNADAFTGAALAATTFTAGAGLTGGGTLADHRDFAVGAGAGIQVNADDVQLEPIADDRLLANVSGSSAAPVPTSLSAFLDAVVGTSRGTIVKRGASSWEALARGADGEFLKSNADDLEWDNIPGGGDMLASNNLSDVADAETALANLGARARLSGDRTYYVRADGSDSNDGLTNSSGGAFATRQKAFDVIATLDIGEHDVTVQIADGTYTDNLSINKAWVGSGEVSLIGNIGSPANVLINGTNNVIELRARATLTLAGGYRLSSSGGNLVYAEDGYILVDGPIHFGDTPNVHVYASRMGRIRVSDDTFIDGDADNHIQASHGGMVRYDAGTITFLQNAAFNAVTGFAYSNHGDLTFTGTATIDLNGFTATGKRWSRYSGIVQAAGKIPPRPTFFPGSITNHGTSNEIDLPGAIIRPAQITSNQNNYDPVDPTTGVAFADAAFIFFSTDASRNITGLDSTNVAHGQRVTLVNVGSQDGVLVHNSASSTAGNRFFLPSAVNLTIPAFGSYTLVQDRFNQLWRVAR